MTISRPEEKRKYTFTVIQQVCSLRMRVLQERGGKKNWYLYRGYTVCDCVYHMLHVF